MSIGVADVPASRHRRDRRRCTALTTLSAVALAALVTSGQAHAAPTPPPPPKVTQGQVNAAQSEKDAIAAQVGQLSAQVAQAQAQLQLLQNEQELAEQKVAYRMSLLAQAQSAAQQAKARVAGAQHSAVAARAQFVDYLQATYMSGDLDGTTGSLLTAKDPSALLEAGTLEQYQADNQTDAVGQLQRATVRKSNADAVARAAVLGQAKAATAAQDAKAAADASVAAEQTQKAALQSSMAGKQSQLQAKQLQLATLNHQRATYLSYVAEQQRLAAIARAKAIAARNARIAAERAAAARAAAAARHHRHSGGGGGSNAGPSGGGTALPGAGPSAPSNGSWTAAKGRRAVRRARAELGVMYAWAGGNQYGPTTGVCDASNGAPDDCYVTGFDCSGLAMYAWGRGWAHYAATQYSQAGSYHPSLSNLKPGDLLFWSLNGSVSGIHHVAIYIGDGKIIQAPNSGEVIEVSSMYAPGSIFGATRPLT